MIENRDLKTNTFTETEPTSRDFSTELRALVEHEEFRDKYSHHLYKRETHIKGPTAHLRNGDHIILYFNPHLGGDNQRSEAKIAECFVEIIPPGPGSTRTEEPEFFRWNIYQDPQQLYPQQAEKIWAAIASLNPVEEESSGEA